MILQINEILQRFRDFVNRDGFENRPVLTAYVNHDPTENDNRRENPSWLVELKNEAKRIKETIGDEFFKRKENQEQWQATEDWFVNHLRIRKPTGQSSVVFTDHKEFVEIDLPLPSPTRLYYGLPQVKHMLFNIDQHKKYTVVLLSGSEYRVVDVFLTRTTFDINHSTQMDEKAKAGRSGHAHKIESRSEDYERRFIKQVAGELNECLLQDPGFERLILGGNQKQANAVKNLLHPAVRNRIVAIEAIEFGASDKGIEDKVTAIARQFELEHDLSVVDGLVGRSNRDGSAVIEKQGVKSALSKGLVKTLVVPYPIDSEEFDDLIVDATRAGSDIEFVYEKAALLLEDLGGVGAVLYRPIPG